MLPPGWKYSDISGTFKRSISINVAVSNDSNYYADKKGLSFSKFVEEALIDKIQSVREELGDFLTAEEYNGMQDRATNNVLAENEMIQSGQITHQELEKGKRDTIEAENRGNWK